MVPSSRRSATIARSWRSSLRCWYSVSGRMTATLFPFSSVMYCSAALMGVPFFSVLFSCHDITVFCVPGLAGCVTGSQNCSSTGLLVFSSPPKRFPLPTTVYQAHHTFHPEKIFDYLKRNIISKQI